MYYTHARNCVERKVYGNSALSAQRVSKSKIIEQSFYKRKCTNDKIANEKAVNVSHQRNANWNNHFICTKMVQLEQTDNIVCWQGCAISKILIANESIKWYNHFGKLFNGSL